MAWALTETSPAILDTGTSLMYIPFKIFPKILEVIARNTKISATGGDNSGLYIGTCDTTKYESIYLLIGENWYEIPPTVFIQPNPGH